MFTSKLLAVCLLLGCASVQAQSNLGELLDRGIKKAGKDDVIAILPATLSYVWPNGQGEATILFIPDGSLSGSEHQYQSNSTSPATGTWSIDEAGRFCSDKYFSNWNSSFKGCYFGYLADGKYYFSASETDRSAKIFGATIKK